MKRKIRVPIVLLLCVSLLCGCGAPGGTGIRELVSQSAECFEETRPVLLPQTGTGDADAGERRAVPFSEIRYERPSLEEMERDLEALRGELQSGDIGRVTARLDRLMDGWDHFRTMSNLAYVRSCQDMTDDAAAEETAWCEEKGPELDRLLEEIYYACGMSPMARQLEEEYFWEGFAEEYADDSEAIYDDELVALYQREAELLAQYRALSGSPTITLDDGTEVDLYSYLAEADLWSYYDAVDRYYAAYNGPLAGIYIELARTRAALAEKLGYGSYEQMQYENTWERDYSPAQAEACLEQIRRWIVPLYRQARATELYSRVETAELGERELTELLAAGVRNMGEPVTEAYDFMSRYSLYDIAVDTRKANCSFQTYLTDYDSPFLFMDPEGTTGDLCTFAHEFGHFVDAWYNYDAAETIDLAEVYSQGMEFLMLYALEGELGADELDSLRLATLLDTLELYAQQASFAAFEHEIYSRDPDTLTPEIVNGIARQCDMDFGCYSAWADSASAMGWIDIVHLFEYPFYVISYPVSNALALQILSLEQQERGEGLSRWIAMLDRGDLGMLEAAEKAGLESPFGEAGMRRTADTLRNWMNSGELAA